MKGRCRPFRVNRVVFGMSPSRPVYPRIADVMLHCRERREAPPCDIGVFELTARDPTVTAIAFIDVERW